MNEHRKFYVSRQCRRFDGQEYVEIVQGGRDHANPDELMSGWFQLGEGREFIGMVAAVEAAEKVMRAWRAWLSSREGGGFLGVACGATYGCTVSFDVEDAADPAVWERLRERAEAFDAKLPRCEQCDDILDDEVHWTVYDPDLKFCSERCAEKHEQTMHDEEE